MGLEAKEMNETFNERYTLTMLNTDYKILAKLLAN